MSNTEQLEKNIAFCIEECEMGNDEIGDILRAIERLGIQSVEFFMEEFIFTDENGDILNRWHEDDHLNIAEFNALYWEANYE